MGDLVLWLTRLWSYGLAECNLSWPLFCSPQIPVFQEAFLCRCAPGCAEEPQHLCLRWPACWAFHSPTLQSLCSSQLCRGTWISFLGKCETLNHSSPVRATAVLSALLGWLSPSAAALKSSGRSQWQEWWLCHRGPAVLHRHWETQTLHPGLKKKVNSFLFKYSLSRSL